MNPNANSLERDIRTMLGDMMITNMALAQQVKELQARVAQLEPPVSEAGNDAKSK